MSQDQQKPLNCAQMLLIALGVDAMMLRFGAYRRGKLAHNTKRGPGRTHKHGKGAE